MGSARRKYTRGNTTSAYVPVFDLPSWIRVLAQVNPLTYAINATRALSLNGPDVLHQAIPATLLSGCPAARRSSSPCWGFGASCEAQSRRSPSRTQRRISVDWQSS